MEITSLANVKAHLSRYVARVHDEHERVMITRNGEPAAILIAPDDLESLEETLAVLSDPEAVEAMAKSREEIAAGDFATLDEVLDDRRQRREADR